MSGIPCDCCGKFMSYAEMDAGGGATFYFEPLNEFGPEICEWACKRCNGENARDGGGDRNPPPTDR